MTEHPIEGLMKTAMESIRDMVDVNTIVGDAVQAPDGTVIIPISRVTFGFAAGGGEYRSDSNHGKSGEAKDEDNEDDDRENGQSIKGSDGQKDKFPFAGGSGAGVSINPVAFMVVGQEQIKLLPVNINSSVERILDMIPEIINKANDAIKKKITVKKEIKNGNYKKSIQETEEE